MTSSPAHPPPDLARASDPTAQVEELRDLRKHHAREILQALGANPATPLDLLLDLAPWVPGRVLRNPALKLHTLSLGAAVLAGAPVEALRPLLAHPDGAFLLPLAVDCPDPAAGRAALESRALSPELLGRLAARADTVTLSKLAREPMLPVPVLIELARHGDRSIQRPAVSNPSLPPAIQRQVLDELPELHGTLLDNANLDPALATRLLESSDRTIRQRAAACARLPPDDLIRCARHPDPALRESAAGNPSLPLPTLVLLTGDRVAAVRAEAAAQERLSAQLLALLAEDPSDEVRQAVASNPTTPPGALALLAEDPEERVRELVAANPHTPAGTLESLAQPPHPPSLALLENPRLPAAVAQALVRQLLAHPELDEDELIGLLTSPVLPAQDVAEVLRRHGPQSRLALPRSTPEPLLRQLARGERAARIAVATHRVAPVELLTTLAWDRDPAVTWLARTTLQRRGLALDE